MPKAATDRNLLFGILALQMDFISRDALIAAMSTWVPDKTRTLAQVLLEQKAFTADTYAQMEALVQRHLALHGNDAEKSLAAVRSPGSIRAELQQIADSELHESLRHISQASVPHDPGATVNYDAPSHAVGTATSYGSRFRIIRPHAKGGLGQVYVAQDEELGREVALKEIQEHYAHNTQSRSRFLLEAEITGGLEHPGIVPVYGLGQYADGRPFYAMRFIRGDSLQNAIKAFHNGEMTRRDQAERIFELRKLLNRFIDVSQAIQYAHDRGVLHRDLKPGNIMLGKYGETLVVDWGLAKVIGNRSESDASAPKLDEPRLNPASGSAETVAGVAVGTPQFMSPEQAAGRLEMLGPASDVYSLGATLFTLLTGKVPIDAKDTSAVIEKVQKGDIQRPRALNPDVDPAIEAVCMKAMALKPADRYASPRHLADDIERWLADNPVSAWPEPWAVRTKRWVRRHQTLVTSGAASLFIILIAVTAGLLLYQAEQNRRKTRRLLAEEAIRTTLDQAEKPRQELHGILAKPGGVFSLLNEPARWEAYLESSRISLKAGQDLIAGAEDGVDPTLADRAGQLTERLRDHEADRVLAARLEKIRMDRSAFIEGKFDFRGAAKQYAAALPGILNDPPAEAARCVAASPIKEQLIAALDDWAYVADSLKDRDVPVKLLAISRAAAPDPAWGDRIRQIDIWRNFEALVEIANEAPMAALTVPQIEMIGKLIGDDKKAAASWFRRAQLQHPADFWVNLYLGTALRYISPVESTGFYRVALGVRPKSTVAYNDLGNVLMDQKKVPEAVAALEKALELDPNFVPALNNLGVALRSQKKLREAAAACQKAIDLEPTLAMAYINLGIALAGQKKLPEAIAAYNQSIDLDPNDPYAHYNLGAALREQKKLPEALAACQKALDLDQKSAAAHNGLGAVYYEQKKLSMAITAFERAINLDPKDGTYQRNLGITLRDQKKLPQALAAYKKATDLDPTDAIAYHHLGNLLRDQNKLAEAIAVLRKAVQADPTLTDGYIDLGIALVNQKNLPEAIKAFQTAVDIDSQSVLAFYNLANTFYLLKKQPEAIAAYRKAIDLSPTYAEAHCNLAQAFMATGNFEHALAAMRKGHELGSQRPGWPYKSANEVKRIEGFVNLEKRTDLVLKGAAEAMPNNLMQMASMCQQYQQRYAAATKLYRRAFDAQPNLANNLVKQNRYKAAQAAALGGTFGDAKDPPTAAEKAALRKQARDWLQADLAAYAKQTKGGQLASFLQTDDRLSRWRADADLAGVRDAKALAGLPEDEQADWRKFWTEVEQRLKQVRGNFTGTPLKGTLTDTKREYAHEMKMQAGKTYIIEMKSAELDSYLKLTDSAGNLVAENDDIDEDNLDSRIIITPKEDGVYGIVATSFEQAGRGAYTIVVRQFSPTKLK